VKPLDNSELLGKLAAAWPTERWRDVTVLVAVSGGADSVALARALASLKAGGDGRLILAHFNHRLRGAESDADQAFVADLASKLEIELIAGDAAGDLGSHGSGEGLEGAARQARYDFLSQAAAKSGARYIATAHTADDQVETVLHNILRGTGLAGLAGIPRFRRLSETATLIRPFLDVTRAEVIEYLQALNQSYRDDSTNQRSDYTRNRIRLQLLPLLENDYNPRVRQAILRIAQIADQAGDFLSQEADRLLQSAARPVPGGIELNTAPMAHAHPAVIRQALMQVWQEQGWPQQDMSFDKWELLVELVQRPKDNGLAETQMLPGRVHAQRHSGQLQLTLTKPTG
jgi:tRNA(Ile)-lysidine synthase